MAKKGNKLNKIKNKKLNFRMVLKLETILCLVFAGLLLSTQMTGYAVSSGNSSIGLVELAFLGLGILGLITLIGTKKK